MNTPNKSFFNYALSFISVSLIFIISWLTMYLILGYLPETQTNFYRYQTNLPSLPVEYNLIGVMLWGILGGYLMNNKKFKYLYGPMWPYQSQAESELAAGIPIVYFASLLACVFSGIWLGSALLIGLSLTLVAIAITSKVISL